MDIFACIGSSCHLKGSYNIINILKEEISKHELQDKVNLSASFCLGQCQAGVTIKVGNDLVTGWTEENASQMFEDHVLKELER